MMETDWQLSRRHVGGMLTKEIDTRRCGEREKVRN